MNVDGRKRPRVKSIRFHTLWWLLRREAMVRIWSNAYANVHRDYVAAAVLTKHPFSCLACTRSRIASHPAERFWP